MPREKLPPGLPPPWLIEKIKEEERKKRERERPQPQIPLYDDPPNEPEENPNIIIIDPGKKTKESDGWFQL